MQCKCGLPCLLFILVSTWATTWITAQGESHNVRSAAREEAREKRPLPRAVPSSLRCEPLDGFFNYGLGLLGSALMRWRCGSSVSRGWWLPSQLAGWLIKSTHSHRH
ncbi:hypothetical protein J3F83DRAFT_94386 [Trichoderma novae-zelandiae]